ncbi:MAG: hypothetical protein MJ000_02975 [Bacteroidales bacterium]|nr:hypothetical protein [Bacteroidales bacterium]
MPDVGLSYNMLIINNSLDRRCNSKTWSGSATDEPMFDCGFTGHEHLYASDLINMNGRVYDPMTSSFLSPDNYVQDPTSQQGFNRYAYCFYNPLKYVDPTGERASGPDFRMMAAMIERMIREQCYNKWRDFLMGMGCISMIDINGSWGEFGWCKGISGSGNNSGGSSIALKNENGEMIADTSGPMMVGDDYKKKCAELGITPGEPIPEDKRNDEFLRLFQETFFPNMPMDLIREFTCENVPFDFNSEKYSGVEGVTKPIPYESLQGKSLFSGISDVYFNQDLVSCSPEDLYYTMGHEFVHVSQCSELACVEFRFTTCLNSAMDYWAYSWQCANGGRVIGYNPPSYNCLNIYKNLNYINFKWTCNLIHP